MKVFSLLALVVLISCNSNEITESKDVSPENIYQHYSITHKEGDDEVEVLVQFRFGSITGTTIMLNKPSSIKLDGKELKVDSSTALGAYYRVFLPVNSFYGKHVFEFTDIDNKVYRNEFNFEKFILGRTDTLAGNKPVVFTIKSGPLKGDDRIEISTSESDSTFKIIHTSADSAGIILIPEKEIKRQRDRHLSLDAVLFRKIPLQQNTTEGGEIEIRQVLKPIRLRLRD